MLDIQRWNWQTHQYDPYQPDPAWHVIMHSDNLTEHINCTNCGDGLTFGEAYTSRELHNSIGLGYPVCNGCYQAEFEHEKAAKNG